ncbi:hypothetical protein ASC95_19165 [Pelomonas sp. Root1217]|uniref:hypothetical protein n=1 Tax=Pelomonas sp. Root1217 TaxID=1736430 RepID=UPI00070F662F|nr:hypothetical protein [Pelomonas sp. Root1217]KQV48093.1 hypothetical protein ASC95_19165 [Pelomonas sp. Root1217]
MRRLACVRPVSIVITPVPPTLSSLLHRTRAAVLVLLLVALPLQGVVQLVAGFQSHRHVHVGAATRHDAALAGLTQPLRALLDHLHAAQDPRLQGSKHHGVLSKGPGAEMHEHGGVFHKHAQHDADVLEIGDPADDAAQGGVTAFLAWLPAGLTLPVGEGGDHPVATRVDWRDRAVAPPLTPPRG